MERVPLICSRYPYSSIGPQESTFPSQGDVNGALLSIVRAPAFNWRVNKSVMLYRIVSFENSAQLQIHLRETEMLLLCTLLSRGVLLRSHGGPK